MNSLWLDQTPAISTDVFEPGKRYDVVIAGAGLTGLVTGIMLARAGMRVAVVESRIVGAGTTGHTTAKLSLLQGSILQSIRKHHSPEVTRAYLEGNREGQAWLTRYLEDHRLAYQLRDAYTYTEEAAGLKTLEREAQASSAAGLAVDELDGPEIGLPFHVAGALRLAGQVQFDPVEVLAELCLDLRRRGGKVFENTRFLGAKSSSPLRIGTSRGNLTSDQLILATGTPVLDRGGYFAKLHPERSYLAAYLAPGGASAFPRDMFLSIDTPTRSLRSATVHGRDFLLVGGNGHLVGAGSPGSAAADLDRWARERFPGVERTHAWSAQDYRSINRVPFVGPMPRGGGRIHVATGYNKWGMSNAVAAALRLSAGILGGQLAWGKVLGHRLSGPATLEDAGSFNAQVAGKLVSGWVGTWAKPGTPHTTDTDVPRGDGPSANAQALDAGMQARVIREGLRPVAVSTIGARTCKVSAICPHLGGILRWNDEERSWDCPLHGSRFTPEGTLIEGPATSDLKPVN